MYATRQLAAGGESTVEILAAALRAAQPRPGLSWLDVGCGKGGLLRTIRDRHSPARLTGVDVIDWLDPELRDDVDLVVGAAEDTLPELEPADRVLLVETLEHLEAPWTVLRHACRLVKPGGRVVVTVPNVASLRHRLELLVRGQLTSFRPDHPPHMTPALPHVIESVMAEEGCAATATAFAGRDVIPWTGGRRWPADDGRLLSVSAVCSAHKP